MTVGDQGYGFAGLLLLALFIPAALFLIRGASSSGRRWAGAGILSVIVIALIGLFVGAYERINPFVHLIVLFSVVGAILILLRRT